MKNFRKKCRGCGTELEKFQENHCTCCQDIFCDECMSHEDEVCQECYQEDRYVDDY